jgi:hypothetical protein
MPGCDEHDDALMHAPSPVAGQPREPRHYMESEKDWLRLWW